MIRRNVLMILEGARTRFDESCFASTVVLLGASDSPSGGAQEKNHGDLEGWVQCRMC
jgi:hypothetical protein